jgi:membrane protein YqaA with SNARE-associated domain
MKNKLKEKIKNAHLPEKIKQGIKKRFFSFLFFVALIFFLVLIFLPQLENSVQSYIIQYGLLAIFLVAFLADILMQPIGPDVPLFLGIVLGLHPIQVLGVVLIASLLATSFGYYLGLKFGTGGFLHFYGEKKYNKIKDRYLKYDFIVPIAALTPVPYVPICWVSGIFKMNKMRFLIYAMVPRTIRLSLIALFTYFVVL